MTVRRSIRLLQFRLRTLFVIVTGAALCLGLWISWIAPARQQAQVVRRIEALGGSVSYKDRFDPPVRAWLSSMPVDYVAHVVSVELNQTLVTAGDLTMLQLLPHLESLSLEHASVTDDPLAELTRLPHLQKLSLADN